MCDECEVVKALEGEVLYNDEGREKGVVLW